MHRRTRWIAAGTLGAVLVGGVAGTAIAAAGRHGTPLTGSASERAARAALEHTGGGTVIETEADDDGAAYTVEIRLRGGQTVEVRLDDRFNVIGQALDDDQRHEQGGQDDS